MLEYIEKEWVTICSQGVIQGKWTIHYESLKLHNFPTKLPPDSNSGVQVFNIKHMMLDAVKVSDLEEISDQDTDIVML